MCVLDYIVMGLMGVAAVISVSSFSILAKYLFDRGLADRNVPAPNIITLYKTYMTHTKNKTGRIGRAFWVHSVSAGIFIFTGAIYTIFRFILPRFL